jgi:hypothetical protein
MSQSTEAREAIRIASQAAAGISGACIQAGRAIDELSARVVSLERDNARLAEELAAAKATQSNGSGNGPPRGLVSYWPGPGTVHPGNGNN